MQNRPKFSADALRRARLEKTLSQHAAASAAGLSLATWSLAERAGVASTDSLEKMAAALGVSLADLGLQAATEIGRLTRVTMSRPKFNADALRRARLEKTLSQQAAATAAGLSLGTWANAERRGVASGPSLAKMAAALGVSLSNLGVNA